jgi:hypothetical protein
MALRNDHTPRSSHAVVPTPLTRPTTAAPYQPAWLQAADHHALPVSPRRLRATISYAFDPWYRVPKALAILLGKGACGCWHECRYTLEGGLRVIDSVYSFGKALHHEQGVALALGTSHQYHAKVRHINARQSRGILIMAALGALCILGLWLKFTHPYAGALSGIGLLALLDAIGRRGRAPTEKPVKRPEPLQGGTPNTVLWGQLNAFFAEEGLDHAIQVYAVRPDPWRDAFHVDVTTAIELEPKLLRSMEKRIYVREGACQLSTCPTNAADKTITIQLSNPLRNVPEAPWLPAASVSGWQPLDLGHSANPDVPFELVLVMRHILIVSRTRGGKTVHLSNIIDRISATRDTLVVGGALVKSAVFDAWRSVLLKKAQTVNELAALLQWLIALIAERDQILKDINSDDDPSNDVDKWDASLGPAVVCIIDEWPEAAEYDGTGIHKDDPDLLGMVKSIMRTGAGLGVSLILACQASGNDDWGSSVIVKQASVKIIGPCSESDTVSILGKDKRDQGYAPHLLEPADEHNVNDAGMAVVDGPGFGADYVRAYSPFKVKARAIKREREWDELGNRPTLEVRNDPAVVIDSQTLPPALGAIDSALRHYRVDVLSSSLVYAYANSHGDKWTAASLSRALRKEIPGNEEGAIIGTRTGRCEVEGGTPKCFHRVDVDQALRALGMAP